MGNTVPVTGDRRKSRWELWETGLPVFQGAVGAFLASTAPAASTGLFRSLGHAREETTAQDAPGTTIGSRHDPDYPPVGAAAPEVVDVGRPAVAHPGSS